MKYHIVTLGCQMNISDSERSRTVLDSAGYVWTDNENEAQLIGIIACSVRQKAIDKVYSRIHKWNKRKANESVITFISGCMLPADEQKFLKLFDIVFRMNELEKLPELISTYGVVTSKSQALVAIKQNPKLSMKGFWSIDAQYQSAFEAFVPIQNGCDKFCTYCAVPYTRGREVSRPSDEIVHEVQKLVQLGYKSITLLGQNVNSYGLDKAGNEISFAELLHKIGQMAAQEPHKFWLYFTSPHPRDMGDDVLEAIAAYPCMAKQIHLPLQAGNDKVLIRMNRQHAMEQYRKVVHSIHRILPAATLFTDIIVGFTGETDEQFDDTRKAMHEFKFNMAYIAKYSPRPGAASARWGDTVSNDTKKQRLATLTDDLVQHTNLYHQNMVGTTQTILVRETDRSGKYLTGHNEGKILVRFASAEKALIGQFVDVKITAASDFSIEGELVKTPVEAGSQ